MAQATPDPIPRTWPIRQTRAWIRTSIALAALTPVRTLATAVLPRATPPADLDRLALLAPAAVLAPPAHMTRATPPVVLDRLAHREHMAPPTPALIRAMGKFKDIYVLVELIANNLAVCLPTPSTHALVVQNELCTGFFSSTFRDCVSIHVD